MAWEIDQIITIDDSSSGSDDEVQVVAEMTPIECTEVRHRSQYKPDYSRLPVKAIFYDYSTQPVEKTELPREFYPEMRYVCPPFRRPIIIDGIGLIHACINCSGDQPYRFPFDAIIRCLFYWIAKGHVTLLLFPRDCNPIDHEVYGASEREKLLMRKLADKYKLLALFKPDWPMSNFEWFKQRIAAEHGCIVTTVNRWCAEMAPTFSPHDEVMKLEGQKVDRDVPLLQPFISHEGLLVFFSSLSSSGLPVSHLVVLEEVVSWEEYSKFNKLQLEFLDQAVQLKVLHESLPSKSRFRETSVLLEVVQRLEPFLPGGEVTMPMTTNSSN